MDRRGFLKGIMAASAAAVAAQFGAPEWMGEEIRSELIKDLSKTQVAMPGVVYDNRPIWTSISGAHKVYVDHVSRELARRIDRDILDKVTSQIDRTVSSLIRAVDLDLQKANITEKVILDLPKVNILRTNVFGIPTFELKAGVEKEVDILGVEKPRVGYIQEKLILTA